MKNFESNPNSVQFGGEHYMRAGHAQHWDLLPALGYGWEYFVGRASAYLTRVKNPELDPSKAGHFLDKLMWLIDHSLVPATYSPVQSPRIDLDTYLRNTYFPANGIAPTSLEAKAIKAVHSARTREGLVAARELCSMLEAGVSSRRDEPDLFKRQPKPEETLDPTNNWPFNAAAASPAYVQQDLPTPQAFSSGGGGDFGGGGATASWEEPAKPAKADDRTFVFGDSAIAATSVAEASESSCRASDYSSSSSSYDTSSSSSDSSSSSSSSSDSGSSGGGGGSD